MIWPAIRKMCKWVLLPGSYPGLCLTPPDWKGYRWLIGPYEQLSDFASKLRFDEALRQALEARCVRLGLRGSDEPPRGKERQTAYGPTVRGLNAERDFRAYRVSSFALPIRPGEPVPLNRLSDREANVKTFWETQRPQAHHIVEFNHLRDLGVSRKHGQGEMDYPQLPAVLLAAEFHQLYISAFLKRTHGWTAERLWRDLCAEYRRLYLCQSSLFAPLWHIAQVILRKAGIKTV